MEDDLTKDDWEEIKQAALERILPDETPTIVRIKRKTFKLTGEPGFKRKPRRWPGLKDLFG